MSANFKRNSTDLPPRAPQQINPLVALAMSLPAQPRGPITMNPWESSILEYRYPEEPVQELGQQAVTRTQPTPSTDPLIYPGLYSSSGFDMLSILSRVASRPDPKIQLGAVDCSAALLLCDLAQLDTPIVYASEAFGILTGYSDAEIMGRNCRFLQAPGGDVRPSSKREHVDDETVRKMRQAVQHNHEVQVNVVNFRKDGTAFRNFLTIIPVRWDSEWYRYCVGFQVEM